MNTIEQAVIDLEARIGLRAGFLNNLKAEDDWSFIIKSHALIEAACAELLTEFVGSRELIEPFTRLELSNKKSGKIAFLKALDLLNSDERRFISALSEIRNMLVHNVKNTTFDLSKYIASLDDKQQQVFAISYGYSFVSEKCHPDYNNEIINVLKNPKETIWGGLKFILAVMSLRTDTLSSKREINNSFAKIGEKILNNPNF